MSKQAKSEPLKKHATKLTWKDIKALAEEAGIHDDDEIDCIELSWGTTEDVTLIKDEDFGWRISQSC